MELFRWVSIYVIVWFLTLLVLLPLWIAPAKPGEPGHSIGAPRRTRLFLKAVITTGVAALIWAGIYFLIASPFFYFRS